MSKFNPSKDVGQDATRVLLETLITKQQSNGGTLVERNSARQYLALESLDVGQKNEIASSLTDLKHALEGMVVDLDKRGYKLQVSNAALESAEYAALISADPMRAANMRPAKPSLENMILVDAPQSQPRMSLEAYSEQDNKHAAVHTIAYNLNAARQNEFGEAFFPTITVAPDEFGLAVSIRLVQVMNEQRRAISGAVVDNFNKRNIIQALIDPEILRNEGTKVIPVVRPESEQYFVDDTLLPPVDIVHEGQTIKTSALAVSKTLSLIGISQTAALLETGILDQSDALDASVKLAAVYIKFGNQVVKFDTVKHMNLSQFTAAVQGNYRDMSLNFMTSQLIVTKDTKAVDGSAVTALADLATADATAFVGITMFGNLNLEISNITVNAGAVSAKQILDTAGNVLAETNPLYALFSAATVVGYDVEARRLNANMRERVQLVDLTSLNYVYGVPLLSPIHIARPQIGTDMNDGADLGALVMTARVRTSNAAVDTILDFVNLQRQFNGVPDGLLEPGKFEAMGAGRFLVTRYFEEADIDLEDYVDSLTSTDRFADISAALMNIIRDKTLRAYMMSGYQAAADACAGGIAPKPTVIIGTDTEYGAYLMTQGDLRTMGQGFDIRVVTTQNKRFRGKIFISFGQFGGAENAVNPLHFGNMAWKPEQTAVLPSIHRNGGNSKELVTQPSFRHVVHLPVGVFLNMSGLKEVAGKVTVNTSN